MLKAIFLDYTGTIIEEVKTITSLPEVLELLEG